MMSKGPEKPTATRHDVFVDRLSAVPEIAQLNLGPLFRSSQPAELTESETEYVVQVGIVKPFFKKVKTLRIKII